MSSENHQSLQYGVRLSGPDQGAVMELYIHIPFCVRKCTYCAFDSFSGCGRDKMETYTAAVLRDAAFRKDCISEPIETIYIGGGTPSLFPTDLLEHMMKELASVMDLSGVKEFSIEANPGTVSLKWLDTAMKCGINRISFGAQAAQDHILQTLGRIHDFKDVIQSVNEARKCGFRNISVDLMFGIPGQNMDDWRDTLGRIIALCPNHISAYGLIPEEGTPLYSKLEKGELSLPDPDLERDMYDTAVTMLSDAGFRQYEISNFARTGYECRHNIGYWNDIPYLGLGLSAASMIRNLDPDHGIYSVRWTNPSSFKEYYEMLDRPDRFAEIKQNITPEEARFETVMLSLRMTSGMRRSRFRELHGDIPERWYGNVLTRFRETGLIELVDDSWRLTRRGMDIQNSILVEFMN